MYAYKYILYVCIYIVSSIFRANLDLKKIITECLRSAASQIIVNPNRSFPPEFPNSSELIVETVHIKINFAFYVPALLKY